MLHPKLIIIGGGISGITIAREAALSKLFSSIIVLEKETNLGIHSSTRNSGVIHAGFYYSPDSFKAKFCAEGNKLMREYAMSNSIGVNKCGKVVVSKNHNEEIILEELYNRGIDNGSDLYLLNKEKINDYEPLASTYKKFLWSPNTWSVSPKEIFDCLVKECKEIGVQFYTNELLYKVKNNSLETISGNIFNFDFVINAAGGYSLEVAKLFDLNNPYKILPFKGLYLKSKSKITTYKRHIYPVPDIKQPFLGIHTTITKDNYLKLGPTAIPVLSPENYSLFEGLDLQLSTNIFLLQINLFLKNTFGFRDLALREVKYFLKQNIIKEANKLTEFDLNQIDFNWHSPGIRPQLFNENKARLETDFVLVKNKNSLHILNSISPAWTCSLKTAKYIIEEFKKISD